MLSVLPVEEIEMNSFRGWLIRLLGGQVKNCAHKWIVLIEHYPTYTQDYWQCKRCGFTKAYENDSPPEAVKTAFCSLAHQHIVNGRDIPEELTLDYILLERDRIRARQVCTDKTHWEHQETSQPLDPLEK